MLKTKNGTFYLQCCLPVKSCWYVGIPAKMFPASSTSAVFQILRSCVCAFEEIKVRNISTMSNWQAEKEKFLSMDINKKRDLCKKYDTLKNIPTWKQFASQKTLLPKIEAKLGYEINPSKNAALADKISIYHGDITELEVCYLYLYINIYFIDLYDRFSSKQKLINKYDLYHLPYQY